MASESSSNMRIVIVEDHVMIADSTAEAITGKYASAKIDRVQTAEQAKALLNQQQPDILIADISIPESSSAIPALPTVGINLLRQLMQQFPTLNIMVLSAYVKSLVRLRPSIIIHEGGFTIADKSLPKSNMLTKLDWALHGLNYMPDEMRTELEFNPKWLKMLHLAFSEGLQDKVIAQRMNVAERTVRHYWSKVQDALGVYPEEDRKAGKNIRIRTEIRAREEGLID